VATSLPTLGITTATALVRATVAITRLDQAVAGHPLATAWLYRVRLDAVRRQAAVDGALIDPWHLAALIEGVRLRFDPDLSMVDRGRIFSAAHLAFDHYLWLARPEFDQEELIRAAEVALGRAEPAALPLIACGLGFHAWLENGGGRLAGRIALIRSWQRQRLTSLPVPLTGAASLRAETPWARVSWLEIFLLSLAEEAEDWLQLLGTLERAWLSARRVVADRRRNSRAAAAIDILAAAPLVSARSLAEGLGMAVQNASALLDGFVAEGLIIEVSRRSKRRLYGLLALARLRDVVAEPRRPEQGGGPVGRAIASSRQSASSSPRRYPTCH
jgi:hypothetical protein